MDSQHCFHVSICWSETTLNNYVSVSPQVRKSDQQLSQETRTGQDPTGPALCWIISISRICFGHQAKVQVLLHPVIKPLILQSNSHLQGEPLKNLMVYVISKGIFSPDLLTSMSIQKVKLYLGLVYFHS